MRACVKPSEQSVTLNQPACVIAAAVVNRRFIICLPGLYTLARPLTPAKPWALGTQGLGCQLYGRRKMNYYERN